MLRGPLDQRFESGLTVARDRHFVSLLGAHGIERIANVLVVGIELRRELKLHECFVQASSRLEPAPTREMVEGSPDPCPVEQLPGLAVVGLASQDFRVLDDRAVVILKLLGLLAIAHGCRRGTTSDQTGQDNRGEQSVNCVGHS
jgi:hypothetical protein